ncbi:MAG TPA: metal-dependent transcriptional regulator [Candidatus Acidoferrales bacterium]|nr:metal-dependent transcriptional regulator [Candidatus Acidoferrales bacterium]
MRREKTSVSQEDYLKAIWEMLEDEEEPISARVAEQLGVTPPAVTAALKRMTRDNYMRVGREGRIHLTSKGRSVAQHLALRHQLAEKLLTEVIGLDWAKAHEEAERLEHAISPEVEALLFARFGPAGTCPHGVPLLGGLAKLRRQGAIQLSEIKAGQTAEILCVYERDPKFLLFLAGLKLKPGVRLRVSRREYDQTMVLSTGGRRIHLGAPATSRIWVRRIVA